MFNQFIAWLSLGVIMFDIIQHYVGQFKGHDATLSPSQLDKRAQDEGYSDWEQYVYYNITLEVA